jgi:hypothetical protein
MSVDVTLEGGAVSSFSYELSDFHNTGSIETTVTANGKDYEISLNSDDFGM